MKLREECVVCPQVVTLLCKWSIQTDIYGTSVQSAHSNKSLSRNLYQRISLGTLLGSENFHGLRCGPVSSGRTTAFLGVSASSFEVTG